MFRKKRRVKRYRPTRGFRSKLKPKKRLGTNRQSESIKLSKRRKRRKNKKLERNFTVITASLASIGLAYLIFLSGYFSVSNIEISGESFSNENLSTEIEEALADSLSKNLIFVDTKELSLKAAESFPKLQDITVKKRYPRTLTIDFAEYELAANIINESSSVKKNFIVNKIGYVVKEDFENPALPYIKIKSTDPINPQSNIIDEQKLTYILNAVSDFETRFNLKIKEVIYKPIPREVHLLTEKDFYIWLDIQYNFEEQFKKLKKALAKIDIYNESFEYIDLRIAGNNGDKIIYKRKN